jgi:uncharacterized membrane protein YebE (DUF533 family)
MANIDAMKILGSLLSSGALSRGSGSNVLGSVIGALTGGSTADASRSGGGLGDLVGSMLGGGRSGGSPGGGAGDLPGGGPALSGGGGGGLGDLLGMAMRQFGAAGQGHASQARAQMRDGMPRGMDENQVEQQAETLIRAMINAAKADGRIDSGEQRKIVERLGEVSDDEIAFVQREFQAPLDVGGFARSIPRGMEQQVYAMSLMAIDLDSNPEAQYLHQLAQATGIGPDVVNQIHERLGAPKIYR